MRKYTLWMLGLIVALGVTFAQPNDAEAAFRLGADAIWVPASFDSVDDELASDPDHNLASFGMAAHGNLGFDVFSLGLKLNYFNQGIEFEGAEAERQHELDINAMARIGIPAVGLGLFAEGGLATNPGFDYFGYNIGGGLEYAVFSVPTLDFNLGLMGLHSSISDYELTFNGVEATTNLTQTRLMAFIGIDFGI
jgi:hypothetical protein